MAQSYPIWHEVQACHYKSSKSYGGKRDSSETIYVGTSASNSHEHCRISTTKREIEDKKLGPCFVFKTSIDGVVLKETWVSIKNRVVVKTRSKLNRIKSL